MPSLSTTFEKRKEVNMNNSCQLNHTTLAELFRQATEKIRQDYRAIYQDPEASRKCFDCHNRERNYQIMLNLLERYWKLSQKGANHD